MAIVIKVRLNAILQDYSCPRGQSAFQVTLPDNSDIEDAIRKLALPRDKVGLAAVNLRHAAFSQRLQEGDEVLLFPRLPFGG